VAVAWSKDDKEWLVGTEGMVNGHVRNRENRRQQHRENQSAHVATIRALNICVHFPVIQNNLDPEYLHEMVSDSLASNGNANCLAESVTRYGENPFQYNSVA